MSSAYPGIIETPSEDEASKGRKSFTFNPTGKPADRARAVARLVYMQHSSNIEIVRGVHESAQLIDISRGVSGEV